MVRAVKVLLSEDLIIREFLKLPSVYSIVDVKMKYPNIEIIISGYDLPEVKEGEEPKRADIMLKTTQSHIEVFK